MSATQLKNGVRAWHEELLEFVLAHPRASLQETAFYFNASISWISIVKNSDAFQEMWAKRRGEHFSRVSVSVAERVTALAEITVDALTARVEKETREGTASINTLKEVGEMALRSLGFGNKGVQTPLVQVNASNSTNIFVDRETLARARDAKTKLHSLDAEVVLIEHDVNANNEKENETER